MSWGSLHCNRGFFNLSPAARRRLLVGVGLAAGLSVGARVLASQLLRLMLYHPLKYRDDPSFADNYMQFTKIFKHIGYDLEDVDYELPGTAGFSQHAILLRPRGGSAVASTGLWVLFGGNAMVAQHWFEFCFELLKRHGSNEAAAWRPAFLLVDYPGYGANEGEPSPSTVLAASKAAVQGALARLPAQPSELNLLGHSLGSSAASLLAYNLVADGGGSAVSPLPRPGHLILSAPFVSIEVIAQSLLFPGVPTYLLRPLVIHRWDTLTWAVGAARRDWRITVIHGARDEIVPQWMGKAVHDAVEAVGHPCTFIGMKESGHNDILFTSLNEYAREMRLPIVPSISAKTQKSSSAL